MPTDAKKNALESLLKSAGQEETDNLRKRKEKGIAIVIEVSPKGEEPEGDEPEQGEEEPETEGCDDGTCGEDDCPTCNGDEASMPIDPDLKKLRLAAKK